MSPGGWGRSSWFDQGTCRETPPGLKMVKGRTTRSRHRSVVDGSRHRFGQLRRLGSELASGRVPIASVGLKPLLLCGIVFRFQLARLAASPRSDSSSFIGVLQGEVSSRKGIARIDEIVSFTPLFAAYSEPPRTTQSSPSTPFESRSVPQTRTSSGPSKNPTADAVAHQVSRHPNE